MINRLALTTALILLACTSEETSGTEDISSTQKDSSQAFDAAADVSKAIRLVEILRDKDVLTAPEQYPQIIGTHHSSEGGTYVVGEFKKYDKEFFGQPEDHTPAAAGIFLAELDRDGRVLWSQIYYARESSLISAADSVVTAAGIYMAGSYTGVVDIGDTKQSNPHSKGTFYVLKHTLAGDYEWWFTFGRFDHSNHHGSGKKLQPSADGGVFLGAHLYGIYDWEAVQRKTGYTDLLFFRLSHDAEIVWFECLYGTFDDELTSMTLTGSGDLEIAGSYTGSIRAVHAESNFWSEGCGSLYCKGEFSVVLDAATGASVSP